MPNVLMFSHPPNLGALPPTNFMKGGNADENIIRYSRRPRHLAVGIHARHGVLHAEQRRGLPVLEAQARDARTARRRNKSRPELAGSQRVPLLPPRRGNTGDRVYAFEVASGHLVAGADLPRRDVGPYG